MARTPTPDVLIVGAGPVGLSAAAGLRGCGVECRLVDRLPQRLPYAKAVGIQPRTFEVWDRMDLARPMAEAALPIRGQLVYVDGRELARLETVLPAEVPYRFAALPQYETERLLEEHLAARGTRIERGTELLSFDQDEAGVTARLRTADGAEEEVRTRYLVGCDGAHSSVRKGLGLSFEGGAFPDSYMLADVEADWDLEPGYAVRATRRFDDGTPDDLLVCVPLPGASRYRLTMRLAPELAAPAPKGGGDGITHGLDGTVDVPGLAHIQEVVDRLAPRPGALSHLRWSSVFRISHRIVDRYGAGRVFIAGDAAHIHPPTGGQGMNTGIQDACNLAWKLARVLRGGSGPALLASYDAERRPVGEEVVGRTVRHATEGMETDPEDPRTLLLREAQLLVGYRGGPLAGAPYGPADAPQPGDRAPDCTGLTGALTAYPLRLLDVLRGRADHVLLLYADAEGAPGAGAGEADGLAGAGEAARAAGFEPVALLAGDAPPERPGAAGLPLYRDGAGEFARLYRPQGPTGFLVRPDGQLAARFPLAATATALAQYAGLLAAPSTPATGR
ncbi:FAD-dependent monooxygenase [Streptomyces sp. NPDC089919]|uniref:FAD-dependent monooxygenase n=1 Tax=Streptomyces sp. NPDC089919 TaxID=3155188 RepID=UPI00342CA9CF